MKVFEAACGSNQHTSSHCYQIGAILQFFCLIHLTSSNDVFPLKSQPDIKITAECYIYCNNFNCPSLSGL